MKMAKECGAATSLDFASKSKGYALITSLKKAKLALEGKTGTVIKK